MQIENLKIDTNTKVNFALPSTGKFYFEFVAGGSSGLYLGVVVGSCANASFIISKVQLGEFSNARYVPCNLICIIKLCSLHFR